MFFVSSSSFDQLRREARTRYGVSATRPQDDDPGMLRFLRRANMDAIPQFPPGYSEQLMEWVSRIPILDVPIVPQFSMDLVHLQNAESQQIEVIRTMRPPAEGFGVLAVDFKSHNELSYDGEYFRHATVGSIL